MDDRLLFLVLAIVGAFIVLGATLMRPRESRAIRLPEELSSVPLMIVINRHSGSYSALCPQALDWSAKAQSLDDLVAGIDQHSIPLPQSVANEKVFVMWEDDGFKPMLPDGTSPGSLPGEQVPNAVGFTVQPREGGGYEASAVEGLDLSGWGPNLEALTSTMRTAILGRFPGMSRKNAPKVAYILELHRAA